ncbi:putative nucleotide-diphospho-sugar transferase [Chitinophaga japonensis]|uniref:Nucleotide-diphospho-sugar transferase n=1 Tax=Chitinophaga japonensis TaxID=104662 RepID=A0A562SKU8_CHIJA|nr:putative nucleotide-diphospho-sugar transferase [Chitinophaga japonensis]TWI81951.1 nucleotide-diphospho-sugar transferase [Chitinophaga japonensis]
MYYLIYLLFGKNNSSLKSELVYSLLSFDKMSGNWSKQHIQVLVYTDEMFHLPPSLDNLPITFRILSHDDIDEWIRSGNGHTLVLKARIMQDFLQVFGANGILIDTDTFFLKDPAPLFKTVQQGHLLMHLKEYPLTQRPAIYTFFQKKVFRKLNGDTFRVNPSFHMWNSGVIGIGSDCAALIAEIVSLIGQIAREREWPWEEQRLIEQTSYSYYLQLQVTELMAADEFVIHYWFFKQARYLLASYFNYFHGADYATFTQILAEQQIQHRDLSGLAYEDLPLVMIRLMKNYDVLRDYHFECLPPGSYIGEVLRAASN